MDWFGDYGYGESWGSQMPSAVPESAETLSQWGMTETSPGVFESSPGMSMNPQDAIKSANLLRQLGMTQEASDLLRRIGAGIGGMLPSANTAAALAPILAAISYARSQGPFNTSRMESTYDQFDPSAVAYEYDQNTLAGRGALTSSLQNRGVMGSSFGNMDMTNFNTTRDLGRRSLVNTGIAARGDMAKALLDAEFKERQLKNNLYGTSLLALGNVFGAKNQPRVG